MVDAPPRELVARDLSESYALSVQRKRQRRRLSGAVNHGVDLAEATGFGRASAPCPRGTFAWLWRPQCRTPASRGAPHRRAGAPANCRLRNGRACAPLPLPASPCEMPGCGSG